MNIEDRIKALSFLEKQKPIELMSDAILLHREHWRDLINLTSLKVPTGDGIICGGIRVIVAEISMEESPKLVKYVKLNDCLDMDLSTINFYTPPA